MSTENVVSETLVILPCICGSISFLFSSLLVIRLVRHRSTLLKKVKERLILGLSVMDIIFSIACIMSTFAGPTYLLEEPTREIYINFHLKGTRATCNLQGWIYNLGVGGPLYNAALCCYYYLSVCHRMQDEKIKKWIEPLMHTIIWIWGLLNASVSVGLNFIWFAGYLGCFVVNPRPWPRCILNPNLPDCQFTFNHDAILVLLAVVPLVVSILLIVTFILLIYCKVRKTEVGGGKWSFNTIINRAREASSIQQIETSPECLPQSPNEDVSQSIASVSDSVSGCQPDTTTTSSAHQQGKKRRRRNISSRDNSGRLSSAVTETGWQYVLAFFVTYLPIMIQTFISYDNGSFYVPLNLIVAFTTPLQGFWNWVIYTRGRLRALKNRRNTRQDNESSSSPACMSAQWWYNIFFG